MRRKTLSSLMIVLAITGAWGCGSTYAPPPRTAVARMPSPVGSGGGFVSVATNHALTGELRGGVGLSDRLTLDFGATLSTEPFGMFGPGLTWHVIDHDIIKLGLTGGFGLGFGGQLHGDEPTTDRFAAGGYVGADLGFQVTPWFGLYLFDRNQLAWAEGIPETYWGYYGAGIAFDVKGLTFGVEVGFAHWVNSLDSDHRGPWWNGFVGYRWGTRPEPADTL